MFTFRRFERVSTDDLMSLASERGSTPLQVGAVMMLDASESLVPGLVVKAIADRVCTVPRLRQRLVEVPWGCGRPVWADDRDFAVGNHSGARNRLEAKLFGKRILFTNRDDWPVADVVAAYRPQSEVESGFRQMKDPHVVSFGPMHHWTDQKIRVHIFHCVLALTIAHLMRQQAERAGLDLSVRELLATLAGIGETVLLYHDGGKGRPRTQRILTDTDPTQQRLAELFGIDRYAPTR